jgi:Domain of unknown function (DUF4303)
MNKEKAIEFGRVIAKGVIKCIKDFIKKHDEEIYAVVLSTFDDANIVNLSIGTEESYSLISQKETDTQYYRWAPNEWKHEFYNTCMEVDPFAEANSYCRSQIEGQPDAFEDWKRTFSLALICGLRPLKHLEDGTAHPWYYVTIYDSYMNEEVLRASLYLLQHDRNTDHILRAIS